MTKRKMRWLGCCALALVAVSCKKEGTGGPGDRAHVAGTPHADKVVEAWKSAGLSPEPFSAIDPAAYHAGYCSQGRVQGIEAIICEYSDDDTLDRAKQLIQERWGKEGVHTGVALRTQRTLLAVADRTKSDPNGKTISKLVSAFKRM